MTGAAAPDIRAAGRPPGRGPARAAAAVLAAVVLATLLAPLLAPVPPDLQTDVVATRFLPPGAVDAFGVFHLLGTDRLGRDVWSRLLHGARVSLLVGGFATVVALTVGTAVGAAAALGGRTVRALLLWFTDFALALPRVVLLLLLAALWQPGAALVVLTLGLTGWMPIARIMYAETAAQLGRLHVEGAVALGAPRRLVLVRHVLPHVRAPLLAAATLGLGHAITLEAGLSFLGLGVQPPQASWGSLIASGRETVVNAPWVGLAPGIALVVVVVACTLLADRLDPAPA
jgi:peptide/nickel transport system permease protein